jgi:hypothetical protein
MHSHRFASQFVERLLFNREFVDGPTTCTSSNKVATTCTIHFNDEEVCPAGYFNKKIEDVNVFDFQYTIDLWLNHISSSPPIVYSYYVDRIPPTDGSS